MSTQDVRAYFSGEHAATYDNRWVKLTAFKDALHLGTRLVFGGLPAQARVLCVGAGTGAELFALASAYPGWHFTAVEPAGDMLDILRRRAEEAGIASRCAFHEGYLDTLADHGPFDAATAILVSQFLTDRGQRERFYREIARRLGPNGLLVSADLAGDIAARGPGSLVEVWLRMLSHAGVPDEQLQNVLATFGREVDVPLPAEVEAIVAAAGFEAPVRFCQTLLIHALFARRAG